MQRTAIILACFFLYATSFAQQYPIVHYTPKDGLVNSRVRKAYQDSKGKMYFLTFGGLSMYDGARFKNYTRQNGLATDLINDILEVGDDSLLIATNTGVINTLVNGKISNLKTEGINCPTINHFYRHTDGYIYLSSDEGLFRLQKNKITRLNIYPLTDPILLPMLGNIAGYENFLILSTIEFAGHNGIYLYDLREDRICDAYRGQFLYPLTNKNSRQVWIRSPYQFYVLDSLALKNGKLSLLSLEKRSLSPNGFSEVSINTQPEELFFMELPFEDKFLMLAHENRSIFALPLPDAITAADVDHIFRDKENCFWISGKGGIFKIAPSSLKIFEKPLGESTMPVFAYYSNHGTWYTTPSKMFRKTGGLLTSYMMDLKVVPAVFFSDGIKLLASDAFHIYEAVIPTPGSNIVFNKIISLPDSLFFGKLIVDPSGNIIGQFKGGIGVWKDHKMVFSLPIPHVDYVEKLAFDKNGLLWVVSRYLDPKCFRLHPEDPNNYLELVHAFDKSQINGSPRAMVIDKQGYIWIGTRSDGLFRFRADAGKLTEVGHFHTGNGMTDNFILGLACDSSNNIIAGTQSGIDRLVSPSNGQYLIENLTKSNNYFSYVMDVWVEADHQAYGRTYSGVLLQISPLESTSISTTPQLLLEEMRVNAEPFYGKTKLTHRQNNISFLVAAPSFIDEKQVSYSYFLEGSGNNHWSDTSATNSTINLINLAPGEYKLHVKAFFPSTPYVPSELSYPFFIRPPWWQTWWFKIMIALLISTFLVFTFRFYYKQKMEKQLEILERQQVIEKERTRIATDMHDDLGAGLSRIKFLSETIGIKKQQQESIEEEVNKIKQYSHEMIDKMGEIVWALNEKNDTLNDLLSYTRVYAVEYLTQNGIACKTDISDMVPPVFVSGEFRRNVFLTIKEALHNVVKHSQATHVTLSITANQYLDIEIKDNGVGMNKTSIRLFSNGLANMEKRVKEIGGHFTIANSEGTMIKMKVPLST